MTSAMTVSSIAPLLYRHKCLFQPLSTRQGRAQGSQGDGGKTRFIAGLEPLSVQAGLKREISLTFVKQGLGFSAMSL